MAIFIYGLACPIDGVIRYVGKSNDPRRRLKDHRGRSNRFKAYSRLAAWISDLAGAGMCPNIVVLEEVVSEDWRVAERRHIAALAPNLLNATTGGEGFEPLTQDDEFRRRSRVSAAWKARMTDPAIREQTAARLKRIAKDPALVSQRAETLRSTLSTPEAKRRRRALLQEIGSRPEVVEAKRRAALAQWARDDVRAQRVEKARERWQDGAYVSRVAEGQARSAAKMSESAKRRFADPNARATMVEHRRTPEYRAMMAEKTRLSWEKRRAKQSGA